MSVTGGVLPIRKLPAVSSRGAAISSLAAESSLYSVVLSYRPLLWCWSLTIKNPLLTHLSIIDNLQDIAFIALRQHSHPNIYETIKTVRSGQIFQLHLLKML
jgi:hypothetical protein